MKNNFNEGETPFLANLAAKNWQTLPSLEPCASYVGFTKYHIKYDFIQ